MSVRLAMGMTTPRDADHDDIYDVPWLALSTTWKKLWCDISRSRRGWLVNLTFHSIKHCPGFIDIPLNVTQLFMLQALNLLHPYY